MTLKDDWGTGDTYTAADMNTMAAAVNNIEAGGLFIDNGDGTWTVTVTP